MDAQKFVAPLSVAAAVIGIYVFLRTGNNNSNVVTTGSVPTPLTIPSAANIPAINYNVATPTPPPLVSGTGVVQFAAPAGVTLSKGFSITNSIPKSQGATANGCGCRGGSL